MLALKRKRVKSHPVSQRFSSQVPLLQNRPIVIVDQAPKDFTVISSMLSSALLFCFAVGFVWMMSGCSSGRVEMKKVFLPPPPGISAYAAIEQLKNSKSDEERTQVLAKVESDRAEDFDWKNFWNRSAELSVEKFAPTQQTRLFQLISQTCKNASASEGDLEIYHQYADFIINKQLVTGLPYLVGEKKLCALPLGRSLTSNLIRFLFSTFDKAKGTAERIERQRLAGQLHDKNLGTRDSLVRKVNEIAMGIVENFQNEMKLGPSEDWTQTAEALTLSQWESLAEYFVAQKSGEGLHLLVTVQQAARKSDVVPFFAGITARVLRERDRYAELHAAGSDALLEVVNATPEQEFQALSAEQLEKNMNRLVNALALTAQEIAQLKKDGKADSALGIVWQRLKWLRSIERNKAVDVKGESRLKLATSLRWLERAHAQLEEGFLADAKAAEAFLADKDADSADGLWMKLSILRRNYPAQIHLREKLNLNHVNQFSQQGRLDQALVTRVPLFMLGNSADEMRQKKQARIRYCHLLENFGLATTTLTLAELQDSFSQATPQARGRIYPLSQPGCYRVTSNGNDRSLFRFEDNRGNLAFHDGTVLVTPGFDIEIMVRAHRGAIAYDNSGRDLSRVVLEPSYQVIPLVFGIRTDSKVHFVAAHHVLSIGNKRTIRPRVGGDAGNLRVAVNNAIASNTEYFEPAVISAGGEGEIVESPNQDTQYHLQSSLTFMAELQNRIEKQWSLTDRFNGLELVLMNKPQASEIRKLVHIPTAKIEIVSDYLSLLEGDQVAEIKKAFGLRNDQDLSEASDERLRSWVLDFIHDLKDRSEDEMQNRFNDEVQLSFNYFNDVPSGAPRKAQEGSCSLPNVQGFRK